MDTMDTMDIENSIKKKIYNYTHEDILDFISKFNEHGQDVINCFTSGCCYWFASILSERFSADKNISIYYDPIPGHFCYRDPVTQKFYDITGEYTPTESALTWLTLVTDDQKWGLRLFIADVMLL